MQVIFCDSPFMHFRAFSKESMKKEIRKITCGLLKVLYPLLLKEQSRYSGKTPERSDFL